MTTTPHTRLDCDENRLDATPVDDDTQYRIEYSIMRRVPGSRAFDEIGTGWSGDHPTVIAASTAVAAAIARRAWDTMRGDPDPRTVLDEPRRD